MKKTFVLGAALAAALLAGSTGTWAQDKRPTELRFTTGTPPKGNPWVTQLERIAKAAEDESKGELKLQVFLNSQLGSEQDTLPQVVRGRIDLGAYAIGSAAGVVPEIALLMMPFYFDSSRELDCVIDSPAMAKLTDELFEKRGLKILSWSEIGMVEFWGKKPFASPADLNGAKAAIFANKTLSMFYSNFGASPMPLGAPEWVPAFQTGMADVVFTQVTFAVPSGLSKVAPVVTRLDAYDAPAMTLMNKATFDKLPKAQQEALVRAVKVTPIAQLRAEARGFGDALYGMHEKAGGRVVTVTPEQRQAWRKAMEPLYPKIVKETGPGAEAFFAVMETARKACTK